MTFVIFLSTFNVHILLSVTSINLVPFNYIDDDFECINLLLNFYNDFPIFSGFV